jgi:D-alanyl-D-alanine dipeptidase
MIRQMPRNRRWALGLVGLAVSPFYSRLPDGLGPEAVRRAQAAGPATTPAAAGLVDLAQVAPSVVVDMRYAGARNFVGRPVHGYRAARCLLSRAAARALGQVQRQLAPAGLGLMVYDCYRPQRAVDDFIAWAKDEGRTATKASQYPDVPKSQLFKRGYIALHSAHSRGSTVDLTLVPLPWTARAVPPEARDCRSLDDPPAGRAPPAVSDDGSLAMGTTFDCFDERSHTDSPHISPAARHNRWLLRAAMEKQGFVNYAREWWHFTLANEPFAQTAFDFEIR